MICKEQNTVSYNDVLENFNSVMKYSSPAWVPTTAHEQAALCFQKNPQVFGKQDTHDQLE